MAVVAVVSACGATAKTHRRDRPTKVCQAIPRYLLRQDRESGCPLSASPLEEYIEAFQRAIENAQLLLEELFAELTPISEDWVLNSLVTGLLDDQDADRREFAAAALGETPPR